jgi:hypothetical protein
MLSLVFVTISSELLLHTMSACLTWKVTLLGPLPLDHDLTQKNLGELPALKGNTSEDTSIIYFSAPSSPSSS